MSSNLLILISAVLNSAWNTAVKPSKDKPAFVFITISLACLLVMALMFILKIPFVLGGVEGFWFALLAGIFEGGCLISLAKSFSNLPAAKAYSIMRGGAMVFVWTISLSLGIESFDRYSFIGSVIVLLGIALSSFVKSSHKINTRDIAWPVFGALCICGYHMSYAVSLRRGAEPMALFIASLVVSLPFIFYPIKKDCVIRCKNILTSEVFLLIISTLGSSLGFVFFLYGFKEAPPGYAFTLRNTSIFFSILFSFLIKDKITRVQIVSAVIIGIGAVVMGLGR